MVVVEGGGNGDGLGVHGVESDSWSGGGFVRGIGCLEDMAWFG